MGASYQDAFFLWVFKISFYFLFFKKYIYINTPTFTLAKLWKVLLKLDRMINSDSASVI